MLKLRVSNEKSISSLQIGLNVQLKDFKYKTPEQGFQNVPFFRPFYSCRLSALAFSGSEAGGGQTLELFRCKST